VSFHSGFGLPPLPQIKSSSLEWSLPATCSSILPATRETALTVAKTMHRQVES
jgi:hypothetical protein